jgi:HD-GYP domain-containing protein (c-di-GMP phosphodiesterase class II)
MTLFWANHIAVFLSPQYRKESDKLYCSYHKLDISRELLYRAARLTDEECHETKKHVEKGAVVLKAVSGPLRRIIPIILAHHDKFDGSGYQPTSKDEISLEARIISVADVYDSLTSDHSYRKAVSPFDTKEIILNGSGTELILLLLRPF